MYYTYVLKSLTDDQNYVGYTKDFSPFVFDMPQEPIAVQAARRASWFSFAGVSAANEKNIISANFAPRAKRAVKL